MQMRGVFRVIVANDGYVMGADNDGFRGAEREPVCAIECRAHLDGIGGDGAALNGDRKAEHGFTLL